MPIKYIEGNIISSDEDVIIHGCNTKGKFGKGFAQVVRKNHPQAAELYDYHHKNNALVLGSVIWAFDKKLIGHALIQPTYGRPGTGQHISYKALRSALLSVKEAARNGVPGTKFKEGFQNISMPLIGSNLGGGEWSEIENIIEDVLEDIKVSVYVLPGNKPSINELIR